MAVFKAENIRKTSRVQGGLLNPVHNEVAISTEALDSGDEQVLLLQFDSRATEFLTSCLLEVPDLDSGTPALVFDVGLGDEDGVIDTSLVSGSTAGQAGGVVVVVDPSADMPVDATGEFLILDVTTAAGTAAAGNITVFGTTVREDANAVAIEAA